MELIANQLCLSQAHWPSLFDFSFVGFKMQSQITPPSFPREFPEVAIVGIAGHPSKQFRRPILAIRSDGVAGAR